MAQPKVNSDSQKELNKAQEQFDAFDKSVKEMTLDKMSLAPERPQEEQTKMSGREQKAYDAPYIKPVRSINSKERFNEAYREEHKRAWEYVKVICENFEIIGEQIEMWTKKFAGDAADFWKIPVNKPIYVPRLVAKQIAACKYHRITMEEKVTNQEGGVTFHGSLAVDHTKNRLDCRIVNEGFVSMAS